MSTIPMYPLLKIKRKNEVYLISSNDIETSLLEDADLFFGTISLRHMLDLEPNHEFDVKPASEIYKYCNQLLHNQCDKRFVIYDCEFDRWLCIDDSGEVEWTTSYNDEDVAHFSTEQDAEEMIYDQTDNYAIHTRYYPKESNDD